MLVKKTNKRLSDLHKIHLLVCKDWEINFSLAETMSTGSTRIIVRIFETFNGSIPKYFGEFLRSIEYMKNN